MDLTNKLHLVGKDIIESPGYIGDHEEDAAVCYEAAKEIERLRARVSTLEFYANGGGQRFRSETRVASQK